MPESNIAFHQSSAPTSAYNRHIAHAAAQHYFYHNPPSVPAPIRTERDILEQHHRFLRPSLEDPTNEEAALAKRYYDKLYKEYAVVELSRWREGMVAMRWRTDKEVSEAKGEKGGTCGGVGCGIEEALKEREVDFRYQEDGVNKRALVKVWVCGECRKRLDRAQGKEEGRGGDYNDHRKRRRKERHRKEGGERRTARERRGRRRSESTERHQNPKKEQRNIRGLKKP